MTHPARQQVNALSDFHERLALYDKAEFGKGPLDLDAAKRGSSIAPSQFSDQKTISDQRKCKLSILSSYVTCLQ